VLPATPLRQTEDLGGNLSAASNSASSNTYVSGLFYEHSTGAWTDLDEINWTALPEFTGKVTTFSISPRTQEDFFNFEFDGFIYINTGGSYQFNITSSDGSRLELDGAVLINNDGIHASRTLTSTTLTLSSGPHRINVKYFEFDESHVITVRYKGPDTGNSMVTIPSTALKSGNSVASSSPPTDDTAMRMTTTTATVYPNPTTESDINVQMESEEQTPVYIKLIDFSGRQVFGGEFTAEELKQGVRVLPTEKMQNGIYLMQINQNGKITQERISIRN
jgi:hypothetical protein